MSKLLITILTENLFFYGKYVLAILKTCYSIGTEELFTNVHELIETVPYFLLTLLFTSPSSLLWQSVWFLTI